LQVWREVTSELPKSTTILEVFTGGDGWCWLSKGVDS